MNLKKRVKALELAEEQNNCDHTFQMICMKRFSSYVQVSSCCLCCDKKIERSLASAPIFSAEKIIRDALLGEQK